MWPGRRTAAGTAAPPTHPRPPFLSSRQAATVKGWVIKDFPAFAGKEVTLVRCYSMAADGGVANAMNFHAACDGNKHTVAVVKTSDGYVFGGAADVDWGTTAYSIVQGDGGFVRSEVAFIFCIKCKVVPGRKQFHNAGGYNPSQNTGCQLSPEGYCYRHDAAVVVHPRYTPGWGRGDFVMPGRKYNPSNDDPPNQQTRVNMGNTFPCDGCTHTQNDFGGAHAMDTDNFEVWVVEEKL